MYACTHIQTCIWGIFIHMGISYEGMYLCISYFIMDSVCTGIHIHIYTYNIRVYFWTLLWSNVCRVCVLVRTCIYQYTNTPIWINIRPYMYTCVFNRDRCRTYIHIYIYVRTSLFLCDFISTFLLWKQSENPREPLLGVLKSILESCHLF